MLNRIAIVILITLNTAYASFLRLVPEVRLSPDEARPGRILIAGTIENQGDESAFDVQIETVKDTNIVARLETLMTNEKKEFSIDVSESDMGLSEAGLFTVPFRVVYRDANRVAFSAPFITSYSKRSNGGGLLKSSPISIVLDEKTQSTGQLELSKETKMDVKLTNTSSASVELQIEGVTAKELELNADSKLNLAPLEEKTLVLEVKNKSALSGSTYGSFLIVSGALEGQRFSDYVPFQISVNDKSNLPVMTWVLVVLLIVFVAMGLTYARRERQKEPTEDEAPVNR